MNRIGSCPGSEAGRRLLLSEAQIEYAYRVALSRHHANERQHRTPNLASRRLSETDAHAIGAICEVAVAVSEGRRRLECPLHVGDGFRAATAVEDVGPWEVKGTTRPLGRLIVPATERYLHKRRLDSRYLLVRWMRPVAQIVGWQYGAEFFVESCVDNNLPTRAFVAPWLWEYE